MGATIVEDRLRTEEARRELAGWKMLAGKRAFVTGGSRGIGRATALAFSPIQAHLFIVQGEAHGSDDC